MTAKPIDACLACGGKNLTRYLDLGATPLANSFHRGTHPQQSYPLGLNVCMSCHHSQLTHAVPPDDMFRDYPYVSGTTKTLRDYFEWFVTKVEDDFKTTFKKDRPLTVLEIGSNDGTLLKEFKRRGHIVKGIDPAEEIATAASKSGIPTVVGYWNNGNAARLTGPFDVIVAMNVLGHVQDPLQFLRLAKTSLNPYGRMYVQTSQARMLERGEFDTVYHEHLSFFTVRSFLRIMERASLCIDKIEHVPVHGESYLLTVLNNMPAAPVPEIALPIGKFEVEHGFYTPETYTGFQARVDKRCAEVRDIIVAHRKDGYKVIGYGAAAKGMTFINYAGLELDYLVDDNSNKQGKLSPGSDIKVRTPHALDKEDGKVLFVIPAWNFEAEIKSRIGKIRPDRGDKFLTYFPEVKVS